MKIDLHCHSKYSKRPSLWLMQKLGCPESFTEPVELYHMARQQGMGMVTITDHNVIEGALEIADLPGAVVGCEYTTYFPEDRCKVHVLAYNFTEAQHKDLTAARENILDLVEYMTENKIPHACAHPFFWVNDRLTPEHIEKLVLLFKNWELNGDISPDMNACVRQLTENLTPADIERLVEKHGITPHFPEPWKKNLTCGSDDHSSLHLTRSYTQVPHATNFEEFWTGVENGQARVRMKPGTPQLFARNVYGIAYQFYKGKFGLERYVHKDFFLRFMDRALQARLDTTEPWLSWLHMYISSKRRPKDPGAANGSLFELARIEAEKLIRNQPDLLALVDDGSGRGTDPDMRWYEFVNQVSNKVLYHFGGHLVDRVVKARIFDLFHSLGSAGALYALLAPYFVSFGLYAKQRSFSHDVLAHFDMEPEQKAEPKVAHFTDTFHDVNGVARTIQQQLATALKLDKNYTVVTCHPERAFRRGLHQFAPVGHYSIPEYPELHLLAPPFLQMLQHCYEERVTHIHVSTPGPVGLAALGIARILGLPISGTYHTAVPQYVKILTDDGYVEDMAWKAMLWFYNQLDSVYVPSRSTGAELIDKGISADKIRVYPRGVNTDHFHPSKRNGFFADRFGMRDDRPIMLYVGRVSKEKNLHRLADAYKSMLTSGAEARLVIVGDGPYREEMERELADTPAVFTGYLDGEELTAAYASGDVLVFPSLTDTFGNVVLEAQASGLPVVVSDQGGPQENLIPGETGLVVHAEDSNALAAAMVELVNDPKRRKTMGRAARSYIEQRGFAKAFERLYAMYIGEKPAAKQGNPLEGVLPNIEEAADVLAS